MENMNQNEMAAKMRKVGICMNFMMGVSLSFFLSLIGMASSGHFQVKGWLVSFAASTILSILIGFCIPIHKIGTALCTKLGLKERTLPFHLVGSLISDCFYTPLMSFSMIALAYYGMKKQLEAAIASGAPAESLPQITFLQMFIPSLVLTMIADYFLIFTLQPLFLKILLKKSKPQAL
ncbi:MAG: hypothetical protein IJR39_02750 [Treponema sp.]|nr:hypothetical protein [Treponema sp.]